MKYFGFSVSKCMALQCGAALITVKCLSTSVYLSFAEQPQGANGRGGGAPDEWTIASTGAKPLPLGLHFDPATGIVSGVPWRVASAVHYTVTASNDGGRSFGPPSSNLGTMKSKVSESIGMVNFLA